MSPRERRPSEARARVRRAGAGRRQAGRTAPRQDRTAWLVERVLNARMDARLKRSLVAQLLRGGGPRHAEAPPEVERERWQSPAWLLFLLVVVFGCVLLTVVALAFALEVGGDDIPWLLGVLGGGALAALGVLLFYLLVVDWKDRSRGNEADRRREPDGATGATGAAGERPRTGDRART